jgi:hypothetical protein
MSELSPELLEMVEATRAVESPTLEDRGRVRLGLGARLAGAAAVGAATTLATDAAAAGTTAKAVGLFGAVGKLALVSALVAGTAGTAGVLAWRASRRPDPAEPAAVAPQQAAAPRPAAPAREARPEPLPGPVEPTLEAARDRAHAAPSAKPTAKTAAQSLERELELLRSAQRAMDGGQAPKALAILRQYAAEFPEGVLREEYQAVQIMALCAAGNQASAREAAERFVRSRPGSPLSKRIRTACGTIEPRE